jgi:hypothetical protein
VLLKEKKESNHEWEEKVHRKNISREGQSIARFGQWDVSESLRYKVLCLRRYNCQLEKEQEQDYSMSEFTSFSQKRPMRVNDNGKVIDERVYEWFANACCRNIPVSSPIL